MWLRATSLVLLLGLFGFSLYGVWYAYTMPEQVEEPVALVNYQHNGWLDHLVYINPSHLYGTQVKTPEEGERSLYFTEIIDDIDVSFNYDFIAEAPITELSSDVEIVAIVTGPSGWQKEVPLYDDSDLGRSFSFSFPLELDEFDDLINEIEEELGMRRPDYAGTNVYNLIIEARVDISGNTGGRQIRDTFVQSMQINVGRNTLEWDDEPALSQRKSDGGFSYKHQGSFSYTLELEENSLYDPDIDTLGKEPYQWPPVSTLAPGSVYFTRIIDVMLANFSYQFLCDKPIDRLTEEVEVKAILEYPEVWSKTFILVPKTQKSGNFRVDFAVDTNSLAGFANMMRDEIGMGAVSYNLTIMAVVHTTAKTDFGTIDEVFTHSLEGTLTAAMLTWDDELESSQAGSIMGSYWVPNPEKFVGLSMNEARITFPITAAISFPFAIYLLIINIAYKPVPPSRIEKEARRAKKKHKGLVVDVKELPDVEGRAITVISLSSLDDLITTAENLFKPVLHKAEEERHTYCVMDGAVRYEYVGEVEPSDTDKPEQVK